MSRISKKRNAEESSITDVLKSFIEANKLQGGLDKVDVREAWEKVMGPGVNSYTNDVILKNDKLYVALSSSVLREELLYGKQKIITILNEELRRDVIKEIVFK